MVLITLTLEVQANTPTPFILQPSKKGKKLLKKSVKAGKKPKGTITASATDSLGATAQDAFAVKLKPKKR